MAYATCFTKYENQYITVDKTIDVKFIINLLMEDNVLNFQPSCDI